MNRGKLFFLILAAVYCIKCAALDASMEETIKLFDQEIIKSDEKKLNAIKKLSYFNGNSEVIGPRLVNVLYDPSPSVRFSAYNALALLTNHNEDLVEKVRMHALKERFKEPTLAVLTSWSKHLIKTKDGKTYIIDRLQSSDNDIRAAAWTGASKAAIDNPDFHRALIEDACLKNFSTWDLISRTEVLINNRRLFFEIHRLYIKHLFQDKKTTEEVENKLGNLYEKLKAEDFDERQNAIRTFSESGIDAIIYLIKKECEDHPKNVINLRADINTAIDPALEKILFIEK